MPQMILTLSAPVSRHDVCNLFSDSTVTDSTTYSSNSRLFLIKTRVVIISSFPTGCDCAGVQMMPGDCAEGDGNFIFLL